MKKEFTFIQTIILAALLMMGAGSAHAQNTYTLITSNSELVAGAKYLVVGQKSSTNEYFALGGQNTNNRKSVLVTVESNAIVTTPATVADGTEPFEITLGGSSAIWTLYDAVNETYLRPRTGGNNGLQGNIDPQNWTIDVTAEGVATMVCENTDVYPRNILRFNASNNPPLFACYASGQTDVYLYKLSTEVSIPTISATPATVSVTAVVGATAPTHEITVTGANLTADITAIISGTDATQFAVSPTSLGVSGGTLTVTYTPAASAATHTATLTLSSTGANTVEITLNGTTTEPIVTIGDGSETNPFTVADVKLLNNTLAGNTKYWVKGFIVGTATAGNGTDLTDVTLEAPFTVRSNIVLTDAANETDLTKMIGVQLPLGPVRDALNLVDNEHLLQKEVKVYGTLEGYFNGTPGVKNTSDYHIISNTPTITAPQSLISFSAEIGAAPQTHEITVTGTNLTADITAVISGTNTTQFAVTPASLSVSGGTLTITYTPFSSVATHTATLTLSSAGADDVQIQIMGTTTTPVVIPTGILISQIYGGGGNSNAPYTHDYIELRNYSSETITLTGAYLQYASATGSFNNKHALPEITLNPNQYFLIQEASGGTNGTELPTPDYIGNPEINLSASNGKIALTINDNIPNAPSDAHVIDFVGYGMVDMFSGTAPAVGISNTTALIRIATTGHNSNDFVAETPNPNNMGNPVSISGIGEETKIWSANGQLMVNTEKDVNVVIYNIAGQKLIEKPAKKGLNVIPVNNGLLIVKVGNNVAKIFVK